MLGRCEPTMYFRMKYPRISATGTNCNQFWILHLQFKLSCHTKSIWSMLNVAGEVPCGARSEVSIGGVVWSIFGTPHGLLLPVNKLHQLIRVRFYPDRAQI